ncbi:uncharacterized protein Tco025E_01241 [Trypanosoma conorhini]|uniref:Uncharacterized protein n=1 Tax=Trypanosoma conorhini TaxID=83891 RepID=A0A3R7LFP6_9TRYP|nr:uncharacterized protein Tco025E_01241 [Trypanosoma conorhini]RNF26380.1 hypothetical protein Tco025E_01241 [Trypanosoma conorhini]
MLHLAEACRGRRLAPMPSFACKRVVFRPPRRGGAGRWGFLRQTAIVFLCSPPPSGEERSGACDCTRDSVVVFSLLAREGDAGVGMPFFSLFCLVFILLPFFFVCHIQLGPAQRRCRAAFYLLATLVPACLRAGEKQGEEGATGICVIFFVHLHLLPSVDSSPSFSRLFVFFLLRGLLRGLAVPQ